MVDTFDGWMGCDGVRFEVASTVGASNVFGAVGNLRGISKENYILCIKRRTFLLVCKQVCEGTVVMSVMERLRFRSGSETLRSSLDQLHGLSFTLQW